MAFLKRTFNFIIIDPCLRLLRQIRCFTARAICNNTDFLLIFSSGGFYLVFVHLSPQASNGVKEVWCCLTN